VDAEEPPEGPLPARPHIPQTSRLKNVTEHGQAVTAGASRLTDRHECEANGRKNTGIRRGRLQVRALRLQLQEALALRPRALV